MSGEMPLIDISGADARERGQQYGEAARDAIGRSISFYSEASARKSGLSWAQICAYAPQWEPLIEGYLPGIMDEVRGIAAGANRTFAEILALNGRGELAFGNPFSDAHTDGCTSFAITEEASGDGHVYCGQNWDWRAGIADTVIALRIRQPGKPTIIQQIEAGQVGRHGANSAGLALNANALGGGVAQRLGVPAPFIRRKVLESWDMHGALKAIFTSQQSVNLNLLLTHREGVVIDLETTPGRHAWMYPTDGLLVHANHFIAFVPEELAATYRPFSVDSLYRVPRVEKILKRAKSATTPEAMRDLIMTAMRDNFGHPNAVCKHPDPRRHPLEQNQTIASIIVDLTTGDYYVARGTPDTNPYIKLPWNLYDDGLQAEGAQQPDRVLAHAD